MPILVADHHLNNFDEWIQLFGANPPPAIGKWRVARGIDDPNRVHVVCEVDESEVADIKAFVDSAEMQSTFEKVNAMSSEPIEFMWLEDVTPA